MDTGKETKEALEAFENLEREGKPHKQIKSNNMDSIICDCGSTLQLNYGGATIYTAKSLIEYYLFTCSKCGQRYQTQAQPIKTL